MFNVEREAGGWGNSKISTRSPGGSLDPFMRWRLEKIIKQ